MTNQVNIERPELIFWFDAPPRAGAGVFGYVSKAWGNKVYYVCVNSLGEERRLGGWVDCDHGKAEVIILAEKSDADGFVRDFIREHPGAIHVCNGLRSLTTLFIKKWLFPIQDAKIAVWSERPNLYGGRIKIALLKLLHRYLALRYSHKISAYLALGTIGVQTYARCGWDRKILFPFMYDPQIKELLSRALPDNSGKRLRMIYVGRFAKSTKGIDVLMHAIDEVVGTHWQLDLVGGYGENKDETISWAEKHVNVSFCGTWPSNEICQRISEYDVCLVPSRYDGWNVVANEAIRAGIGVIITDNAASDDLIRTSGAGIVVPAGDVMALKNAIQEVIDDPSLADSWKEKARAYSHLISSEAVGQYLMEVLDYTFLNVRRSRPDCPWL